MSSVHSLHLSAPSYYAPFPIMTADSLSRLIDFNIASRVLLGSPIEAVRLQPLESVLARAFGSFMAVACGGDTDDPPTFLSSLLRSEFQCQSRRFGRMRVRQTVIQTDGDEAERAGVLMYWHVLDLEGETAYLNVFDAECRRELAWASYALSYDRILLRMPFYLEVVRRHTEAMMQPDVRSVLELGAGTGNVTAPLLQAGRTVTSVDLSRAMLANVMAKIDAGDVARLTILEDNAEHLAHLKDDSFDGASVLLALYDMHEPLEALAEAIRLLRPGGCLVVTEPKRAFKLQPLLDYGLKLLRDEGVYDELRQDWERIYNANQVLDPVKRPSSLRAEDIAVRLQDAGFADIRIEDSHLGNCATISARKPVSGHAVGRG